MKVQSSKWIYLALLALIWGSSFMLIKRGLVGLSPFQVGSLRIVFAAIFLLAIGFRNLPNIPLHQWKYLALTAFCGTFAPAFLFALAQTQIDSSVSSILNSLTPLNALLIGVLFFGWSFVRTQIIGVLVGFVGTMLLVFNGAMHHPEQNHTYALLIFIATICYGTNVNLIKKYLSDLSPLTITVGNFTVMLPPALLVLYVSDFFQDLPQERVVHSVWFIMILGIVGTGLANLIFFRLIQMATPVFATSVTYLIPFVAVMWGILDGEILTFTQIFGAGIVLFGVYLTSRK